MITLCMVIRNDEKLLGDCLNDIRDYVQEIVIIDQSSNDQSLIIAAKFTQRIFTRRASYFRETDRQFSIDQALYPWILVLNPDEQLGANIKSNLNQLVQSGFDAFLFPRKNKMDNGEVNSKGEDLQLRFFKKHAVSWPEMSNSDPILHTRKVGKIDDGFILLVKNAEHVTEPSDPESAMEKHESTGNSTSTSACDKQPIDLAAHLKLLETQNPQMTDDEARYRLLYELSLS
jgi:glycosyltransferase involved in cell wall biosynthesis